MPVFLVDHIRLITTCLSVGKVPMGQYFNLAAQTI
jgi:hypothetical protein